MIKIIHGAGATAEDSVLLDQMFQGRAEVFSARLGWDVIVENGRERDVYDANDPLYILALDDETHEVAGSLRLMPTTGRTLLRDVFVGVFEEPVDICSPTIWEATRFCVHPGAPQRRTATRIHLATAELSLAMCEIALFAGLTQIMGVFETRMTRVYKQIGWQPEIIGQTDKLAHGRIHAGLWDVCEEALMQMRDRCGSRASVLPDLHPLPMPLASAA